MSDTAAGVFVTVGIVIPRLSPSGSGWEVALIQRKNRPIHELPKLDVTQIGESLAKTR